MLLCSTVINLSFSYKSWSPASSVVIPLFTHVRLRHLLQCILQACGGSIQTSVGSMTDDVLGECALFEEVQVGGERYVSERDGNGLY